LIAERIREYEVVMILSPEATEEEIAAAIERVDGLITGGGGTAGEHNNWGLKRLAYPVQKFREGIYILVKFSMDSSAVTELNRSLKASEDIIRFLVTKV
jgi:small subunit ribosomal protein S6